YKSDSSATFNGSSYDDYIILGAIEIHQTFKVDSFSVTFSGLLAGSIQIQAMILPLMSVLSIVMDWVNRDLIQDYLYNKFYKSKKGDESWWKRYWKR
ncbi:MAG: hypothetical protein ACK56F_21030, partial [bacterium]